MLTDGISPVSLKQRLRFELSGLESRDLEASAVGGIRLVLQDLRHGPQIKSALQELLSGLGTCSKNAVKLRLQLAEYCILKCTSKVQLPGLLPYLTKQGNIVLSRTRSDGACISSLAALMSSCLAKLLHEPPAGYTATHSRPGPTIDTANALCEALLFPMIRSTYRDPEQARVAAGSVVLLGLMEVLKSYAPHVDHVLEAVQLCLELMVQLLGIGGVVQRVPGALLPVCTCLDALGVNINRDCTNRLLQLCLKGAVAKDTWQVRRDALQSLAVLASSLLGLRAAGDSDVAADDFMQLQLLHVSPALQVLIAQKLQVVQLLEDARYDRIAAVRVAAAAALAKFLALPDPPKQVMAPTAEAAANPGGAHTPGKLGSSSIRAHWQAAGSTKSTHSTSQKSGAQRRFTRPKPPPGAILDYGIQVFAPPSPPRQPTPPPATQVAVSPAAEAQQGDAAHEHELDQTPASARRQLDFDEPVQDPASPSRRPSATDAASQTPPAYSPAQQPYNVQSPLASLYVPHFFGVMGRAAPGSPDVSAAAPSQCYPNDALQMLDQNQQGLAAMLAAGAAGMASPGRLDVSHHVHGRVELGIACGPAGVALKADAAGAWPQGAAEIAAAVAAAAVATAAGHPHMAAGPEAGTCTDAVCRSSWEPGTQQQTWFQQPQPAPAMSQQQQRQSQQAWRQHDQSQQQQQQQGKAAQLSQQQWQQEQHHEQQHKQQHEQQQEVLKQQLLPGDQGGRSATGVDAASPQHALLEHSFALTTGGWQEHSRPSTAGAKAEVGSATEQTHLWSDAAAQAVSTGHEAGLCALLAEITSSSIAGGQGEHQSRRSRQQWKLPVTDHSSAATADAEAAVGVAVVPEARSPERQQQQPVSPPDAMHSSSTTTTTKSSSRESQQHGEGRYSRHGSKSPTSSLEVLRSVGTRVQGLLEALSRQTSSSSSKHGRYSSAGAEMFAPTSRSSSMHRLAADRAVAAGPDAQESDEEAGQTAGGLPAATAVPAASQPAAGTGLCSLLAPGLPEQVTNHSGESSTTPAGPQQPPCTQQHARLQQLDTHDAQHSVQVQLQQPVVQDLQQQQGQCQETCQQQPSQQTGDCFQLVGSLQQVPGQHHATAPSADEQQVGEGAAGSSTPLQPVPIPVAAESLAKKQHKQTVCSSAAGVQQQAPLQQGQQLQHPPALASSADGGLQQEEQLPGWQTELAEHVQQAQQPQVLHPADTLLSHGHDNTQHSSKLVTARKVLAEASNAQQLLEATGGTQESTWCASEQGLQHQWPSEQQQQQQAWKTAPSSQDQQQQQQPQVQAPVLSNQSTAAQLTSGAIDMRVSVQYNELFQPDPMSCTTASSVGNVLAVHPVAASAASAAGTEQAGMPDAAGSSAGLAQVERALQKLQTLRNTLQSIGGCVTTTWQQSLRGRALSSGGSGLISAEASSTHLRASSSSILTGHFSGDAAASAVANRSASASQVTEQPVFTTAATHSTQPVQQSPALRASTKDWIRQISLRLQQAGTAYCTQAASDEAAVCTSSVRHELHQQVVDDTAQGTASSSTAAAVAGEPAVAAAVNGHASCTDALQLIAVATQLADHPAAEGATASVHSSNSGRRKQVDTPLQQLLSSDSCSKLDACNSPQHLRPMRQAESAELQHLEAEDDYASMRQQEQEHSADAVADSAASVSMPSAAGEDISTPTAAGDGIMAAVAAGGLQQMLDASDDTALLMSLALKLDTLAQKFNRQGSEAAGMVGAPTALELMSRASSPAPYAQAWDSTATDASVCSASGSAAPWTTIRDNGLYMSSPLKPVTMRPITLEQVASAATAGDSITEQKLQDPVGSSSAQFAGSLVVVPADAAASSGVQLAAAMQPISVPWVQVQDAALQQVLGLTLQQLCNPDTQAIHTASQAICRLQQQLVDYGKTSILGSMVRGSAHPGLSRLQASLQELGPPMRMAQHKTPGTAEPHGLSPRHVSKHLSEQQLQPLLVLLLHEIKQAVREHCTQQCFAQVTVGFRWEAVAHDAAAQQVQWFTQQQLANLTNLLVLAASA